MGLLQFLLGAIAGDIIGYPYERHKITSKRTDFPLFERRSRYTDDTVFTIAVMEWLLNDENLTWDYLANRFLHYGKKYRTKYYGSEFIEWLNDDHRQFGRESWGNGTGMRVSPVGWFFNSLEEVENAAGAQAKLAHNHHDAIVGAKAAAVAVFLTRTGKSKEEIKNFMCNRYGFDLSTRLRLFVLRYSATACGILPTSIYSLRFLMVLRKAAPEALSSHRTVQATASGSCHPLPNETLRSP